MSAEETSVVEETADGAETVAAEEIEPIDDDPQPGRLKRFAPPCFCGDGNSSPTARF